MAVQHLRSKLSLEILQHALVYFEIRHILHCVCVLHIIM